MVLILVAATTDCIFAAQKPVKEEPKKDLFEALKDRWTNRRVVIQDDEVDVSSESWDEEPKIEQKSEPVKDEARVKESDHIGQDAMALRKAVIARLFIDRKPLMDPAQAALKKNEQQKARLVDAKPADAKPAVKGDVVPMGKSKFKEMQDALLKSKMPGSQASDNAPEVEKIVVSTEELVEEVPPKLPPRPSRKATLVVEQQEVIEPIIQPQEVEKQATEAVVSEPVKIVDSAPTQEIAKPVAMPVLVQGKECYTNQLINALRQVHANMEDCVLKLCYDMTEEGLKILLGRYNHARLMIEILSFNQELQGNDFLVKSGLTDKEKRQMQISAFIPLTDDAEGVLPVVESLLPDRFFVENNKVLGKLHLAQKHSFHPDFAWWHNIIADEKFYKQNSYQVSRAFDLIDRSTELLALIKECNDAANFALYKDELERIISELRWLWLVIDIKKHQGMCQNPNISLQYYYASEIFVDVIKNCMKQIQDLINV